ncbi:MAG: hypothetical protein ACYS0C_05225 [Planctomycetota bacterium]|jgi:hypothetical protein
MNKQNDEKLGRRELLSRAGKAGISIVGAGAVSYLLYDATGPRPGVETEKLVTLGDFSVKPQTGHSAA